MRWWLRLTAGASVAACSLLVPLDDLSGEDSSVPSGDAGPEASDSGLSDGGPNDTGTDTDAGSTEPCPSTDSSLVVWFRFDETAGTIATDCSSRQLVAESIGQDPPRWTAGRVGGAAAFDGNTCLDVQQTSNLFAFEGDPFTVTAWVNVTSYSTAMNFGRFLVAHQSQNGWHAGADAPSRLELDVEFGDGGKMEASGSVPLATWVHFAGVYNPGGTLTVYIDGAITGTKANAPARFDALASTPGLRIGCRSPGNNTFRGLVDELRIYARALSAAEIAALAL